MSKIKVNSNKCTGCMICELVCSIAKNEEVNPKRARIRVKETFPITENTWSIIYERRREIQYPPGKPGRRLQG